jgi:hypothetical protein
VATIADVEQVIATLPSVEVGTKWGNHSWMVGGKVFAWERAYSKADIKRFGDAEPPRPPILAVRVEDLHEKEAVLAEGSRGVFTIPHFDGFAAVLVELRLVGKRVLRELVIGGWLAVAPAAVADEWLQARKRKR